MAWWSSTGLQVERAFLGYNPHRRKVPSYYPIMAHLAETTHVLRVKNRSGNVHDGKRACRSLRDAWTQLAPLPPRGGRVRFLLILKEGMAEWSMAHAWKAILVSSAKRYRNTSLHNGFNDLRRNNAPRCDAVSVGVRRRF